MATLLRSGALAQYPVCLPGLHAAVFFEKEGDSVAHIAQNATQELPHGLSTLACLSEGDSAQLLPPVLVYQKFLFLHPPFPSTQPLPCQLEPSVSILGRNARRRLIRPPPPVNMS